VIVDAVLETGVARGIRPGLVFEDEGPSIGEDQSRPDQEHATLADGHAVIVGADQPVPCGINSRLPVGLS